MKELGNNLWLSNEGNRYFILKRPSYQEMTIMCFAIVLFLIVALLCLFSNKLLIFSGSLFCLIGALFLLLKKSEIIIDFDLSQIFKKYKILKWDYKSAKVINFESPIELYVHIKDTSDGEVFYLCTDIQQKQIVITNLSEPEEGNNLIKIFQKKLPGMVENKGTKASKV